MIFPHGNAAPLAPAPLHLRSSQLSPSPNERFRYLITAAVPYRNRPLDRPLERRPIEIETRNTAPASSCLGARRLSGREDGIVSGGIRWTLLLFSINRWDRYSRPRTSSPAGLRCRARILGTARNSTHTMARPIASRIP